MPSSATGTSIRSRVVPAWSDTIAADFSWMRPNRRHLWTGLYLPGVVREGVGEIAIAVDCSGSVSYALAGHATDGSRFQLRHEIFLPDGRLSARVTSTGGWLNLDERRLVGEALDKHFHQHWIGVVGILVGAVGGFIQIFTMATRYLKRDE